MAWYYSAGGEQKGPVDEAEFASLVATGVVRPETPVWQAGMPDWRLAGQARPDLLPPPLPAVPVLGAAMPVLGERYGGFWVRTTARMIDGLVLSIPTVLVILLCVGGFLGFGIFSASVLGEDARGLSEISPWAIAGAILTGLLANFVIQAGYEWYMLSYHSATLGKMAMGLKVVDLGGQRLESRQCLIRVALYPGIGLFGIIPLVGFLVSIFLLVDAIVLGTDVRKQSLHDRIAKTLVVYK